jgi:hypothetical protein
VWKNERGVFMIYFYTGKPGNGKSLHMAMIMYHAIKKGKNVIANFEINEGKFANCRHREKLGAFIYQPNTYWLNNAYLNKDCKRYSYLDGLYNYALQFHKRNGKGQIIEHQTLLVIDECQELFNSRTWNRKDRLEWASFFRQHRKYGYDVYLISQDDKVIDKQIRAVLEYENEHRCINNYKVFGKILGLLCGGKLFVVITRWYAKSGKDSHISSDFFVGKRFYYDFYDSYKVFHHVAE